MVKTLQDFEMFSGDSKTLAITVVDENNAVIDITGYTLKWAFTHDTQVFKDNAGTGGVAINTATDGTYDVTISPSDTATVVAGAYDHESEITSGAGAVSTVLTGTLTLKTDLITT